MLITRLADKSIIRRGEAGKLPSHCLAIPPKANLGRTADKAAGGGEGDALAAMRALMSVRVITRRIDARKVTIKMVDGSLVQGKVNLLNDESEVQRVSDIFTKRTDPFVVVFDATAEGKSGRVIILNKNNVAWVSPEDDPPRQERQED